MPELRFPQFVGAIKTIILKDKLTFLKGKGVSKTDITFEGTDCIRYGELYTKYNEIIRSVSSKCVPSITDKMVYSNVGDVLIPSSGETALDISTASCINLPNVIIGGDINILRGAEDGNFLALLLKNRRRNEIFKLAQGSSVIHVYNKALEKIKVNLPCKEEQNKISSLFEKIETISKLYEQKIENLKLLKKGIIIDDLKSIPSSENMENIENISKKMFSGGTPKSTKEEYYNGNINFLTISDITKSNRYLFKTSKKISTLGLENSSAKVVDKNNLIYTMYASIGIPIITKIDVAIPQSVMAIKLKENNDINFIFYQLLNLRNKICSRYTEKGTQGNLNSKIVKSITLKIPCYNKQKSLSKRWILIENHIEKTEQKLKLFREYKSFLLSNLFI